MDVISINRTTSIGESGPTFGKISLSGTPLGVTLEPTFASGKLVSTGSYDAFLRVSPKSNRLVIELKDTLPRTHIQIHIGNEVFETEGCILVGTRRSGNGISGSTATMNNILAQVHTPLQVLIR